MKRTADGASELTLVVADRVNDSHAVVRPQATRALCNFASPSPAWLRGMAKRDVVPKDLWEPSGRGSKEDLGCDIRERFSLIPVKRVGSLAA